MPFSTTTATDLGDLTASNIISSGLDLLSVLAPIVLIGLAIAFAPKIFSLVRNAVNGSNNYTWQDLTKGWTKKERKIEISGMKKMGYDTSKKGLDKYARESRKESRRDW